MVYQPIQEVTTGQVEAVEALMRLNMLDGTAVPPSLFIPVAERTGAIHRTRPLGAAAPSAAISWPTITSRSSASTSRRSS